VITFRARSICAFALAMLAGSAIAQQPAKVHKVGVLVIGSAWRQMAEVLRVAGYVEGRNIVYEVRDSAGKHDQLDADTAGLVRAKVDVIIATYPAAALAAKRATSTIPIILVNTPDPERFGLVTSLAHPGGNITGTTSLSAEVSIKQLQLLKEAVPGASRIVVLWNPDNPWHPNVVEALRGSSGVPGVDLHAMSARTPSQVEAAFTDMKRVRPDALLVLADAMLASPVTRARIAELALAARLPSIGGLRGFAEAGGMMSYWADERILYERVASYVDRILKGARPGDLPIEQPLAYEIIINRKTVEALGVKIPQSLSVRATVI
jgi:putative tryptophan/tyrosine transport system substrate-binding protein